MSCSLQSARLCHGIQILMEINQVSSRTILLKTAAMAIILMKTYFGWMSHLLYGFLLFILLSISYMFSLQIATEKR
jgi:hypothetical protein